MSVKQNLFVSIFVHKCLMMLNDVEYTTFKMSVTQMSNYLFVISSQVMFQKTLRFRLANPKCRLVELNCNTLVNFRYRNGQYFSGIFKVLSIAGWKGQ